MKYLLLLSLLTSCSLKKDERPMDEAQIVLEFAIALEKEELQYKHKFEKKKDFKSTN